jgi:glycosyltransferase involved in cell wall biosynthesis
MRDASPEKGRNATNSASSARVAVTIPTYNRAYLLPGVIRSVLEQSFTDFELFVSDNASTDGTRDIVASFDDPRIQYVLNETNIGVHANLSRGFQLGSAPYLTVLQDDDLMLPDNLKRKVEVLERNPDVGWVHSAFDRILVAPDGSETVKENTNWVGSDADLLQSGRVVLRRLLTQSYWIPYTGSLFRRDVVGGERFDPEDRLADDLGLALRVAHRARTIAFVAEPLVAARFHPYAHSTREGVVEFGDGAYRASLDGLVHITRVKERFLEEYGSEMTDLPAIRAASKRWLQQELLRRAVERAGADRRMPDTLRAVREVARVEPTVLLTSRVARLLVSSAVGSRGRSAARQMIRHARAVRAR